MRILFLYVAVFIASNFSAQERLCNTTEAQNDWFLSHPELKKQFELQQAEAFVQDQEFMSRHQTGNKTSSAATVTIPVVFHILHTGGPENITDAQVIDAVSILNRDYRKLNADTSNVVAAFQNKIGDTKFQFVLATKDPSGNCTNGIVRHWDSKTNWLSGNFSYYSYTWNTTTLKYLNVYVVKSINTNAAGYTYLPGSGIPAVADAIVVLSNYVGSIGSANVSSSRTLTHEVGHWFNLPHTWGGTNQPGVACGDDGVFDTPITKGFVNCALTNAAICNAGVVENVQNYMDYSYCSRMFTNGQSNRMQIAANNSLSGRNLLSSNNNLTNTGVINPLTNCLPRFDLAANSNSICAGRSLTFTTYTFNANPSSIQWTASNGASVTSTSANGATIIFPNVGSSSVTCVASNGNGSVTESMIVDVLNSNTQITNSSSESFETGNIPAQWTVINPTTPSVKWEVTGDGSNIGLKSAFVKGEDSPPEFVEILETPSYDFKNNPGAQFTFYYAYAKSTANNKDVFKVQASRDCGGTWVDVWTPPNSILASNSGGVNSAVLLPTTEWVFYDLVNESPFFIAFLNEPNVRLRFYFKSDVGGTGYGNRFYLDDINFSAPVGINEISKSIGFDVYPNPSENVFNIDFTLSGPAKIKYRMLSVTGAVMVSQPEKTFEAGNQTIRINNDQPLAKGIYFLNFEMNGVTLSKKIIVN